MKKQPIISNNLISNFVLDCVLKITKLYHIIFNKFNSCEKNKSIIV